MTARSRSWTQSGCGNARTTTRPSSRAGSSSAWPSPVRWSTSPVLILADEPTGALDTQTSVEIMHLLQGLNREGITIVLVTHEPDIARFAGRTLAFRDGRLAHPLPAGATA